MGLGLGLGLGFGLGLGLELGIGLECGAPVWPVGIDGEVGCGDAWGVCERDQERGVCSHLDAIQAQLARRPCIPTQVPTEAAERPGELAWVRCHIRVGVLGLGLGLGPGLGPDYY